MGWEGGLNQGGSLSAIVSRSAPSRVEGPSADACGDCNLRVARSYTHHEVEVLPTTLPGT